MNGVYRCTESFDNYKDKHFTSGRLYIVEKEENELYIYDTTTLHGRLVPTVCFGKIGRTYLRKHFKLEGILS